MNKTDPVVLGIRRIIRAKGLKQKSVAARAGFTAQQFSDMLTGRKILKAVDLFPIASALEVGPLEIYDTGMEARENET